MSTTPEERRDISDLKTDVAVLKTDVGYIKDDVKKVVDFVDDNKSGIKTASLINSTILTYVIGGIIALGAGYAAFKGVLL